jgi:hypothetical protein
MSAHPAKNGGLNGQTRFAIPTKNIIGDRKIATKK